jgi:hypothetical protein
MNKMAWLATLAAIALASLFASASASAQATRTWVSGVGDDANPCSRTAPCKTFAGAISKTAAGGIINCIDPGGFGALTINKSIEIDCLNVKAGVLAAGTNGINVNAAGITVVLRGLSIEGVGSGLVGVNILQADVVHIEKCTIRGFRSGSATGVRVSTTASSPDVFITDTDITENGGVSGGGIISASTGGVAFVTLSNTRVLNNKFGVANNFNSRMRISRSLFAGNETAVEADGGATVTLSDTDVQLNTTGLMGTIISFGNNRIAGNGFDGPAPAPAGPASSNLGQK